jgi:hypothetical protein
MMTTTRAQPFTAKACLICRGDLTPPIRIADRIGSLDAHECHPGLTAGPPCRLQAE